MSAMFPKPLIYSLTEFDCLTFTGSLLVVIFRDSRNPEEKIGCVMCTFKIVLSKKLLVNVHVGLAPPRFLPVSFIQESRHACFEPEHVLGIY